MFLPSFYICLLAAPLFARGSSVFGTKPRSLSDSISPTDVPSFVDDFLEAWKNDNPGLASAEINRLVASANAVKAALLDPSGQSQVNQSSKSQVLRRLTPHIPSHKRQFANSTLSANGTLEEARAIVRLAQKEANSRNRERFQNPRLNSYYDHHDNPLRARSDDIDTFKVNETVAMAAAIVAEADYARAKPVVYESLPPEMEALRKKLHGPEPEKGRRMRKRASSFWMEDIEHVGIVPYGGSDNDGYKVFRNVRDYGAKGDGKTDDTEAINKAMGDQGRCGKNCGASTVKPAIIYFPSGTYLVSSPLKNHYNTQMIGNANDRPIIKAAKSFTGLGVISVDEYTGGNGGEEQWFINQNNFLRQLRNFVVDVRDADMPDIAAVHWQVAQATSIQNVGFFLSSDSAKNHIGIFAENGSGGWMSDLTFFSGAIGIRCGNQQFTTRNLAFLNCRTGIDMLWDWGWTWKSLIMSTTEYGIKMSGGEVGGSIVVLDSYFYNMPTGIYVTTPNGGSDSAKTSITIDNLQLLNVGTAVRHATAGVALAGGSTTISSWILGRVYDQKSPNGRYEAGTTSAVHPTVEELMGANGYYERDKPQYEHLNANNFLSARIATKGDGSSDDTFGLSLMMSLARTLNRPLYIPFGSYIITQTITIPKGSVIVGECWAQLVAKGAFFSDIRNPQVMVRVGVQGDIGSVEIQDLMLTVEGPTAGAILMEWNMAQDKQGSAAMWDTHFRIGGAKGSRLTSRDCPKLTGSVNRNCIAGSMLLHLTDTSSAYLENMWAWVADHDFDSGPAQTQVDVYVARGILIESLKGPVWMYGTASEHTVLYQYQLYGAKNVFMGMIQTESPYYLPNPQAPAPFTDALGLFNGDPDFKDCPTSDPHCAAAWGLMLVGATNVHIFGGGLYNWFQAYTQPCVDSQDCQKSVVWIKDSGNVWIYNLYTIGTVEMVNLQGSKPILSKDNTNEVGHPFTSIINAYLMASTGSGRVPLTADGLFEEDLEDIPEYIVDPNLAPCLGVYSTLAEISEAKDSIPSHCFDTYLSYVQLAVLIAALADYDHVVADGYDEKFKVFDGVIRRQAPDSIDSYMRTAQKSGNFKCTENVWVTCCKTCSWGGCGGCKQCDKDHAADIAVDCPTEISDPYYILGHNIPKISYELINADRFYSEISDRYGIEKDWLTFGDRMAYLGNGCQYSGANVNDCIKNTARFWHGYPLLKDDFKVHNPKDVVGEAYENAMDLASRAASAQRFAMYEMGQTGHADLVDSVSIPAMSMSEAVEGMRSIIKTVDDMAEAERKITIATFVTTILMLIPIAGEAAAAVGGATLRAVLEIAGQLGDVGFTIYELVDDPNSALTTILGFLVGGFSRQPFRDAAAARRGMKSAEVDKLPPRIKTDLQTIKDLRTKCLRG